MKKNILFVTIMTLMVLVGITSCKEERTVYDGPLYIMFSAKLDV